MKKLLLHTCCAPCASGCLDRLIKEEKREIVLYFSNSNLSDAEEFDRRLNAVRILADFYDLQVFVDEYRHSDWTSSVSASVPDYAACPERGPRCRACFAYSLGRTAAKAERLDMTFATTLTVSPHKNSALIFQVGSSLSPRFENYDFKKKDGFRISLERSRALGLYRQNYCGCEFSKRDSGR